MTIHPHPHLKPLYSKSFLQSTSTSLLIINPLHSRVAHRSFDSCSERFCNDFSKRKASVNIAMTNSAIDKLDLKHEIGGIKAREMLYNRMQAAANDKKSGKVE